MQERRTTIRVDRLSRAQYCPADDLVPRDGRLMNLSERGAGLLAHETHRVGARLTVTFNLPEEEEPLTATGVVHWSDARARHGRWYPVGVEWLPMEETVRHRLHAFLSHRAQPPPLQVSGERMLSPGFSAILRRVILVLGLLLAAGFAVWAVTLFQKTRSLGEALEQRHAIIRYLEQREAAMERELASAKTQLAAASATAASFSEQTQQLQAEVGRLGGEVERFQESYVRLREEREQLMQRVLELEQQRLQLTARLSSVPDLRRAIQEAVEARRLAQRQARTPAYSARADAARQSAVAGNRGYLVRNGRPTAGGATLWIRVHEPEALLPQ
jgi:hypothetical protein